MLLKVFKIFVILNILDLVFTIIGVNLHGIEYEANPLLLHAMIAGNGVWPLIVSKLLTTIFAYIILLKVQHNPRATTLYTILLCGVVGVLMYVVSMGAYIVSASLG